MDCLLRFAMQALNRHYDETVAYHHVCAVNSVEKIAREGRRTSGSLHYGGDQPSRSFDCVPRAMAFGNSP